MNGEPLGGFTAIEITPVIHDQAWAGKFDGDREGRLPLVGRISDVGCLPNGTHNGAPVFELIGRLEDGSSVLLETTWALMRSALRALDAVWPEAVDDGPQVLTCSICRHPSDDHAFALPDPLCRKCAGGVCRSHRN